MKIIMFRKILFLLVLKILLMAARTIALVEDPDDRAAPVSLKVLEECASNCFDDTNRTQDSLVGCGIPCKIEQCKKGCEAWEQALDTSCQAVCNGVKELIPSKDMHCLEGCHDALNSYAQLLKAKIGTPPAPALVADSLTATSLKLEWKGIDTHNLAGISYLMQWKYEEVSETWQCCRNQSWSENDQILIEDLHPYTNYRFRVALFLNQYHDNPIITSAPSVVISTRAAGLPTSPPKIDIPAKENTDHYMFQNLEPNKNYSISLTMRNEVGEGPCATVYIFTPKPTVKDTQQPILILGGKHVVMKQGADMFDKPIIIYRTENEIQGVAIHVASAHLFVSTSTGYIYRTSIIEKSEPKIILSPNQVNFTPLSLSVDYLNLHLYILGEVKHAKKLQQITRCDLDGRGLTVAMAGFQIPILHFEVDPYNGYIFWITKSGLFRLDLADISNGIKHEVKPYSVLKEEKLGAFTVDHTNFRLLVSHQKNNTVLSVSLDGREVVNLRPNTQKPRFNKVESLAIANRLFYWTNGEEVLSEGYHPGQNIYFHNAYPDTSDNSFVSVNVLMNASQPVPIPVNPPTGVQAILGVERVKISWQAPYLLGGQGKGAWQDWLYELEIKNEFTGETIHQKGIAGSSHTVYNLKERSKYLIKVAAFTNAGRGPWSTEFRGQTLRNDSHALILWSSNEGLLKSDVTGENINTLVYKARLKESENEFHIADISWYKDELYIVGNNSALYRYNITSHQKTKLNTYSVGSVAVDWIAKKVYWANPKQQIIIRANLNGSQQEPMFILEMVKELMIDSLEAYLYWSTNHAVEVARLNGQERRYYHLNEIFIGKQVMGLTLDTENRYVYWIVRSYESGSVIYRAPTAEKIPINNKIVPEKVSALQRANMQGPLCYFSEHLLWLQDDRNAVIGDLSGHNTAIINGITLSDLYMVAVMDPAFHQYPKNLTSETVAVLPNAVDLDSIRVEGSWRNFNISWNPVKNVNYGTVFYEVKFADYINTDSNPEITVETTIPYNNSDQILPYSILEVTVKAFTYWENAHHSRKILRSPQSVPTQPMSPRAFIEFHKSLSSLHVNISAIFRWDQPEFANGIIQGYRVRCWFFENAIKIEICDNHDVLTKILEYAVYDLVFNTTYYFQVQAYTTVGAGPYSDLINVTAAYEYPVPQLLVATTDAVKMLDIDQEINYTLTRHIPIQVSYSAVENKIYWINELTSELVMSDISGANVTKILALNNTAHSLCVDWVAKHLYWSEYSYKNVSSSYIMKLDLTMWEAGIIKYKTIVTTDKRIVNLDILPFQGKLFWIELINDRGIVMESNLDGEHRLIFGSKKSNNACNCSYRPLVTSAMTIDKTDIRKPVMYWVMEDRLNVADIEGCMCGVVYNASFNKDMTLTVDKINIYWSNNSENQIYYLQKTNFTSVSKTTASEPKLKSLYLPNVRSIIAFGKSLQSYPTANCLIPSHEKYNVTEINKTPNSIVVNLPSPVLNEHGCKRFNLPATKYVIQVSECVGEDKGFNSCDNRDWIAMPTYERRYEIKNLKPFTKYRIKLELSNFYSDLLSGSLYPRSSLVLSTGVGRPGVPENFTVEPLTPTMMVVYWMPPKILNSAVVWYEVHWILISFNDIRQKGEQVIKEPERKENGKFFTILQPFLPGQEYQVYVRVYPANFNEYYNETSNKTIRMYSEPNNLTVSGVSINSMNISWIPNVNLTIRYLLQYKDIAMEEWQVANNSDYMVEQNVVMYYIEDLQPVTLYNFRLILTYPGHENFTWPPDGRFTFQTLGDVPSAPGMPLVTRLRNSVYQLNWEPAQAHGSQVTLYRLEGSIVDDNYKQGNETDNENEHWSLYYNGTDNYWIITGDIDQKYRFRVQAKNAYGFGAWSKPSAVVNLTESTQPNIPLMLGLISVIIMLVFFCFFSCQYRERKIGKRAVLPRIVSDVELATLREIPHRRFVKVRSNVLYASTSQTYSDDSALPKIRKEQITLKQFLGSGAFGKVYEGSATDLEGSGATPVAIKMLRKDASEREKTEFLQEAMLMSRFQHKNVLRLLGVCLDTTLPLLVLELMSGDLLAYLRESRSLPPTDSKALRLQDLLAMCEDVARGCSYLEELHFVHRDLACRNCLVSAKDRENRVVKIGDFGLARDIYKHDYYRKEGEGMLPIRWMAPESLVDGVFTSQSDVWSFGVLMWEITSLGQQPYPARTNTEVLHYVRDGGRLSKPLNCPPSLHLLMQRCWNAVNTRPSFKVCLENIVALRNNTEDAALKPEQAPHYPPRKGNSLKSGSSEDMAFCQSSNTATTTPQSCWTPKYLEILGDVENASSESPKTESPINDYEVPRSIHISDQNIASTSRINYTNRNSKCSLHTETTQERKEHSTEKKEQTSGQSYDKRPSITSLNLPDRRDTSVLGMSKKCNTLDSLKSVTAKPTLKRDSFSFFFLNGQPKYKNSLREQKEVNTEDTSSHNKTILSCVKNNTNVTVNGEVPSNESAVTKNASCKVEKKNHTILQNGITNNKSIVANGTVNRTKQTPVIEDSSSLVTYTNIRRSLSE
ncbi:proto-oncogene tyrosine-protein kinase ROS isoform X2 [Pseudomyrmex gracilis]|uniref:proto-oncogene tyrosine-protein kinase ROS isoform X2 n=1 Tax=Pseudomyrmex gracilis TaxID=219809 RepID=UPI000995A430|nr:proto-oncogene tyrosine-protein kinase ROS isoform X2 [Pseudomyrmex gracilis]